MLLNAMAGDSASEVYSLVQDWAVFFDAIFFDYSIFFRFVGIVVIVFLARLGFWYSLSAPSVSKKNKRSLFMYIAGHCGLECILAFVIGYVIIKLTFANPESYIINYIIAPGIGLLGAIYADDRILMPLETSIDNPLKYSSKSSSSESHPSNSSGVIQLTINNGTSLEAIQAAQNSVSVMRPSSSRVSLSQIEDPETADKVLMKEINELKDIQISHADRLESMSDELSDQSKVLDALRESMMNDKKIILKDHIKRCALKGYVTPDEDERIRIEYHSYRQLDGNGEIQSMYEERFVNLPIHDD